MTDTCPYCLAAGRARAVPDSGTVYYLRADEEPGRGYDVACPECVTCDGCDAVIPWGDAHDCGDVELCPDCAAGVVEHAVATLGRVSDTLPAPAPESEVA